MAESRAPLALNPCSQRSVGLRTGLTSSRYSGWWYIVLIPLLALSSTRNPSTKSWRPVETLMVAGGESRSARNW